MLAASMISADVDYTPIDIHSLRVDTPLICDLYLKEGERYVLYRKAPLQLTRRHRERLSENGITHVWICVSDEALTQQQLVSLLSLPSEEIPPVTKAALLYGSARSIVRSAMTNVSPKTLASLEGLVATTVDYVVNNSIAFSTLVSVITHDSSVYSHAVNVTVYSLGLARFIGLTDQQSLRNLGMGAMLHDIGKTKVPSEIMNKPEALSEDEWAVVHQHPTWGKELLSHATNLPEVIPTIVTQHHERMDGSGYPEGLAGKDIHQFSRIVAFMNSYEAMSTDHPYRPARTLFEVLLQLKEDVAAGKLDPALFSGAVHFLSNPFSLDSCAREYPYSNAHQQGMA